MELLIELLKLATALVGLAAALIRLHTKVRGQSRCEVKKNRR
ncbi:hypothetical protein [Collinsella sp. zg1085]|nr:hypothetical protein [Collinsella sp. zg1085]